MNRVMFVIGVGGSALFSLLTIPLLGWVVSVEDVGRFSLVQVYFNLGVITLSLGLHQSYVREYFVVKNEKLVKIVLGLPLIVFILLALPIFFLSRDLIFRDVKPLDNSISLILMLGLFVLVFNNVFSHVSRMKESGVIFALTMVLPKLLFPLMILGIYYFGGGEVQFNFIVSSFVFSLVAVVPIYALSDLVEWSEVRNEKVDRELVKRIFSFGLPLIGTGVSFWGIMMLDRVLLRVFIGFKELGVYSMAVSISASVGAVTSLFGVYWQPLASKWMNGNNFYFKVRGMSRTVYLIVIIFWFLSFILARISIYFLPEDYAETRHLIPALFAGPLLYMLSDVTSIGIGWSRKTVFYLYSSIISLFISVALNLLLIPYLGAKGAASASVISCYIYYSLRSYWSSKLWVPIEVRRLSQIIALWAVVSILNIYLEVPLLIIMFMMMLTLYVDRFRIKKILLRNLKRKYVNHI